MHEDFPSPDIPSPVLFPSPVLKKVEGEGKGKGTNKGL